MLSRRELLATLSAAPAAFAAPKASYEPTLAAQTYVFSQVYAMNSLKVEDHISEVFETLRDAGFHAVELTSNYFADGRASNTGSGLMLGRLKCPVVYQGLAMHTAEGAAAALKDIPELVKTVKSSTPISAVNLSGIPKANKEPKTDSELALQADTINKIARELKKAAVRVQVHQHDAEMAQDAREWRYTLKNTDPKLVDICLDIDWVKRGGQDVMTILKEALPRLASMHVRNSKAGVWTEAFGDGDIDYAAVTALLKQNNYRGLIVVELAYEKATDPKRALDVNLKASREYAEKIFDVKA